MERVGRLNIRTSEDNRNFCTAATPGEQESHGEEEGVRLRIPHTWSRAPLVTIAWLRARGKVYHLRPEDDGNCADRAVTRGERQAYHLS